MTLKPQPIFLLWLLLLSASCSNLNLSKPSYTVQPRDLQNQIETGNGERLAKPVSNRPVLVNNGLVFSIPGNAVLGIAMSVGAIKTTVESLEDMENFNLVSLVRTTLTSTPEVDTTLEPYCYIFGHPNAYVEARMRIVTSDSDTTVTHRSERRAVSGEASWSDNNGQLLIQDCEAGILTLLEETQTRNRINTSSSDRNVENGENS